MEPSYALFASRGVFKVNNDREGNVIALNLFQKELRFLFRLFFVCSLGIVVNPCRYLILIGLGKVVFSLFISVGFAFCPAAVAYADKGKFSFLRNLFPVYFSVVGGNVNSPGNIALKVNGIVSRVAAFNCKNYYKKRNNAENANAENNYCFFIVFFIIFFLFLLFPPFFVFVFAVEVVFFRFLVLAGILV